MAIFPSILYSVLNVHLNIFCECILSIKTKNYGNICGFYYSLKSNRSDVKQPIAQHLFLQYIYIDSLWKIVNLFSSIKVQPIHHHRCVLEINIICGYNSSDVSKQRASKVTQYNYFSLEKAHKSLTIYTCRSLNNLKYNGHKIARRLRLECFSQLMRKWFNLRPAVVVQTYDQTNNTRGF